MPTSTRNATERRANSVKARVRRRRCRHVHESEEEGDRVLKDRGQTVRRRGRGREAVRGALQERARLVTLDGVANLAKGCLRAGTSRERTPNDPDGNRPKRSFVVGVIPDV